MADQPDKTVLDQIAMLSFIDETIREKMKLDKNYVVAEADMPRIKATLLKDLNEAINTHMVSLLKDEDLQTLSKLLDSNPSNEALDKFFIDKVPYFQTEMSVAMLNFRIDFVHEGKFKEASKMQPPRPELSPAKKAALEQVNEIARPAPVPPIANLIMKIEKKPEENMVDMLTPLPAPIAKASSDQTGRDESYLRKLN